MGVGQVEGRMGSQKQVKLSVRTVWTSFELQKCQPQAQTCLDGLRDVSPSLG